MKKTTKKILQTIIFIFVVSNSVYATKLVSVSVVDKDHIMLYFKDGEVAYTEPASGSCAYSNCASSDMNQLILFGQALNTVNAGNVDSWNITSGDDLNFGVAGKAPTIVYRKSKLEGMSQEEWSTAANDFVYDWAYEHSIFLKLPFSMVQGKNYTIVLNPNLNSDVQSYAFTYDIFNCKSEAVKVNIVGYLSDENIKAADLYMWMGDGGARDYSSFVGKKVYIYNVDSKISQEVGTVSLWKTKATEYNHGHKMIQSNVWKADFTGFSTPGKYRLVIEDVGASEDFEISPDAYYDPFKVSLLGFFYMRIGQDNMNMSPVPRRPLWIPNVSPANCKVYLTTMHPYHPEWNVFGVGDKWDLKNEWDIYKKPGSPTNPNAYGGHSDALDWDRHLGHVSIIYDLLLPYFISDGAIGDDDLGIAESGNGIPDVIDEARNEVDFWLRLRDGKGYSHGLNNPNSSNVLYQAAPTAIAAWANATNAAMLANCFMISGNSNLMAEYRDSAIAAYNYASSLADQMLNRTQGLGAGVMSGKDFKLTAAAFLYNLTGNTIYEADINALSSCTTPTSVIYDGGNGDTRNQLYAVAAYLFSKQQINYPNLWNNMKSSIINEAKQKEANYSLSRPSRRGTDNLNGWFVTEMVIQRTIVAHAISDAGSDKDLFANALILEADWTLGRNPLNMIQMTTATTPLATKRSVQNAYTSGWNDGTPGVHPGHTPYMNPFDWGGLIMGNPTWMCSKSYPVVFNGDDTPANLQWPMAEMYFNVRYVYAANEFTPQQTMRGKMALYGYLHAISPALQIDCAKPKISGPSTICGNDAVTLNSGVVAGNKTITWYRDGVLLNGENASSLNINQGGVYMVEVDSNACKKTAQLDVKGALTVNLGNDKELCTSTDFVLDAGNSEISGVQYSWSTGDTSQTINVFNQGIYSVTVSAKNCSDVTDEIVIDSKLLDVIDDTLCEPGTATIQIVGSGSYSWYDSPSGGTLVSTENVYYPEATANTTFYVAETGGATGTLGKTDVGAGESWGLGGGDTGGSDKVIKVTVSKSVVIKSISVFVQSSNASVTLNLRQNGMLTHTKTVSGLGIGKQIINLDFNVNPGEYILDALGTLGTLLYEASGANFPYSFSDVISFTFNESWQEPWYGLFYDWRVEVGSGCARTPVRVVIDPLNTSCSGETTMQIVLKKGWNLISTNVYPKDSSISSLFNGLDVEVVKNESGFWVPDIPVEFCSIKTIDSGRGYLVKMNNDGVLSVTGNPVNESTFMFNLKTGWNMIGCPFKNATNFSDLFNATNCELIKNFDGFWAPDNIQSGILQLFPGKGYFLKK